MSSLIITDGPAALDLAMSFLFRFDKQKDFTVHFKAHWDDSSLIVTLPIDAQVTALTYESGTPGWLIIEIDGQIGHGDSFRVSGFYNANTRKGQLDDRGAIVWQQKGELAARA